MLYYSHGLGETFCGYGDYFNGHQDDNAICYLTLANLLIHEVKPSAITIAEEVSGMLKAFSSSIQRWWIWFRLSHGYECPRLLDQDYQRTTR